MLRRLSRRELLEMCAALGGLTLAEPIGDPGLPLDVTGIVFSVRGEPLPDARIERSGRPITLATTTSKATATAPRSRPTLLAKCV